MADFIDRFDNVVESGIRTDAQIGAWKIVIDGRRYEHDRDIELGKTGPHFHKLLNVLVCAPSSDGDDSLYIEFPDIFRNSAEVPSDQIGPGSPDIRTGMAYPANEFVPVEINEVAMNEAIEFIP